MADSLKDILIGVLTKDYVSNEIREKRKKECDSCEWLSLGQCLQCNCIANVKQKLTKEQCPLGHW